MNMSRSEDAGESVGGEAVNLAAALMDARAPCHFSCRRGGDYLAAMGRLALSDSLDLILVFVTWLLVTDRLDHAGVSSRLRARHWIVSCWGGRCS
ncbi:hypothetical protein VTH06DRAFT_5275 [Thermothelomyces fergusii]